MGSHERKRQTVHLNNAFVDNSIFAAKLGVECRKAFLCRLPGLQQIKELAVPTTGVDGPRTQDMLKKYCETGMATS